MSRKAESLKTTSWTIRIQTLPGVNAFIKWWWWWYPCLLGWLDQKEKELYPLLSALAMCVPGSPAPVKRTFSTAGEATTGKRNHLASKNLEREILIRKNKCTCTVGQGFELPYVPGDVIVWELFFCYCMLCITKTNTRTNIVFFGIISTKNKKCNEIIITNNKYVWGHNMNFVCCSYN